LTISDVHTNFKFRLDKLDSLNYPNFEPEEIDLIANQAQIRFIKQRYGINNNKRTSFEEDQKRTEDLKNILKNETLAIINKSTENIDYNSVFAQLPEDHFFTINERAIIVCNICNEQIKISNNSPGEPSTSTITDGIRVEVRPIQHYELDKIITDPFKNADYTKILRLMYKNYAELILPDNCILNYFTIRYISKPLTVSLQDNQTFQLSEHTHDEIVDLMVDIALEGIEAKRLGTYQKIINTNE
jgi:hypothetical protein